MKNKNKSIKQVLKKPSDAINAIIKGIKAKIKDDKFKFDMSNYGAIVDKQICLGCLATSTIHTVYDVGYDDFVNTRLQCASAINVAKLVYNKHSNEIEHEYAQEFNVFEDTIDSLRTGQIRPLLRFYEFDYHSDSYLAVENKINELVCFTEMGCYNTHNMIELHGKEMIKRLNQVRLIFKSLNH